MAYHGYMAIKGRFRGLLSAGCSTQDSLGNRYQAGHTDEIMVLSFSHNLSNIDNTDRATHRPVLITKHLDKSTPLLAEALVSREIVDCKINFYRINASGKQERFLHIELTGGLLVDQRIEMPHSVLLNDQDPQEYLAIRYSSICWQHLISGTSGYANWGGGD
ncbi:Hcp family type VI secretion system effector [Pseudomonas putida]|uniref:Hcp family type VI secretion system effector n=1 Tax=Pseudomonas peradeniyensis TaxID=2745488 RepID=A0A923G447_9PSED|nr:Hcp family type VI secretion system effector [Pseudomonas peradeniyensis]MBI6898227.1 Hcp family type VI secretion system effector [Pseudomonas putida]MBV4505828.1 Hcp family type VI secretion system effector [Pseudomonas peradeniyensis]